MLECLLPDLVSDPRVRVRSSPGSTPRWRCRSPGSWRRRLAVYDCMDELSLFAGAPPALLEREAELLDWADLVFTGGPSLYRAKRDRHPNVHCFPSSVDAAHFRRALAGDRRAAGASGAAAPPPRLFRRHRRAAGHRRASRRSPTGTPIGRSCWSDRS